MIEHKYEDVKNEMKKHLIIHDEAYKQWVSDLSSRYQKSQIKAAASVNSEMLRFYWSLGHDIVTMGAENIYGSDFYGTLSRDLQAVLPDAKGFSVTNLKYMRRFYELYQNHPQAVDDLHNSSNGSQYPHISDESADPHLSDIFMIPWGHHRAILDKCKSDSAKALFYVQQTLANNWSRAVLLNWLDTDLYDRQGLIFH